MVKFDYLYQELQSLREQGLFREPLTVDSAAGTAVQAKEKEYILFCSNNYLGLAGHEHISKSVCEAVRQYGFGAGASRLVCGTTRMHIELEERLAAMFAKEAAMVLPAGFMANEALLRTLPQKGDLVLLDKLDHASIIDAVTAGEATFKTYRRNGLDRLEELLGRNEYNRKFVVTESVFSMDGDCADLRELVRLKEKYGAILIVDEAHAVGCLGQSGAGLSQQLGVLSGVDIIVGTMSKALAASGGFIAGPRVVIEYLVNKARSYIYTTALPIATCAAVNAAMDLVEREPQRRTRLADNSTMLREGLCRLGLNTGTSTTHIVPVIIGDAKETVEVSRALFEKGFFISAIRPPTVGPASSRLRISLQSEHTKMQIDSLLAAMADLVGAGVLKPAQHRA